jgi:nucleotide-binding universal stress UspA family protein
VLFQNEPEADLPSVDPDDLADRTWRWCTRVLPFPIPFSSIMIRKGELGATAMNVAKTTRARLVVVPESEISGGEEVVAIVDTTSVPVLVSRDAHPGDAIVVATDLSDDRLPVLKQGIEIGAVLGANIAFMHNVKPVFSTRYATFFSEHVSANRVLDAVFGRTEERLKGLASELGDGIDTVVVSEPDTADAIVDAAWRCQADIVVVGSRPRTRLAGLFRKRVAPEVVERTARSVLVVPFETGAVG